MRRKPRRRLYLRDLLTKRVRLKDFYTPQQNQPASNSELKKLIWGILLSSGLTYAVLLIATSIFRFTFTPTTFFILYTVTALLIWMII